MWSHYILGTIGTIIAPTLCNVMAVYLLYSKYMGPYVLIIEVPLVLIIEVPLL